MTHLLYKDNANHDEVKNELVGRHRSAGIEKKLAGCSEGVEMVWTHGENI